jgi:F0F1-type ATP synthase delta subunit
VKESTNKKLKAIRKILYEQKQNINKDAINVLKELNRNFKLKNIVTELKNSFKLFNRKLK